MLFHFFLFGGKLPHPTQLNTELGRPYFPMQNHNHKPQTVSNFFSAPTQPNSTKFSMQHYFNPTRRFMQKMGQPTPPPPPTLPKIKLTNFSKFDFEPIPTKNFLHQPDPHPPPIFFFNQILFHPQLEDSCTEQ